MVTERCYGVVSTHTGWGAVVGAFLTTVSSEVRMMEMVSEPRFAVYTRALSEEEAMETGLVPTAMVLVTVLLLVLMTETVFEPELAT